MAVATKYKYLFTPLKVGPLILKNRIISAPHWSAHFDDVSGYMTDRALNYYKQKAAGGAAWVFLSSGNVGEGADYYPTLGPAYYDDGVIPGIKEIAKAVHQYDCYLSGDLGHPGHHQWPMLNMDYSALGASHMGDGLVGDTVCKEAEIHEIKEMEDDFARAAERVKKAGCDGVETLCGHNKLLWQFMEPHFNKRTDEYGGSLENRARFTLNVARKLREAVGKDFCYGMRINTYSGLPDSIGIDETVELAKMLEATGCLDYISTTTGWYRTCALMLSYQYTELEPGWENVYTRKIKAAVKLPVWLVGHINEPGLADRMIAEGVCDAVLIARGLIADPEYPNKAIEGREEDIRPCIRCNQGCTWRTFLKGITGLRCQVNPTAGEEGKWGTWTFAKSPSRKKVLIVGAGPGGLECARNLAEMGCEPVVYEKTDVVGGQMLDWAKLPHRSETKLWVDWAERQCSKLGVKINFNSEINAGNIDDILAKEKPDDIVAATGAHADKTGLNALTGMEIAGWDKKNVFTYEDVINGVEIPGKTVLVYDLLDRSIIPLGVAEILAEKGKKVHLVSPWPEVATSWLFFQCGHLPPKARQYELGISQQVETVLVQVTDKGAMLLEAFCPTHMWEHECDAIVLCSERRSNREAYNLLKDRGIKCHTVGDALQPRFLQHITRDGLRVARAIALGEPERALVTQKTLTPEVIAAGY